MSKFFVSENQISNNKIEIMGEDAHHIKNVLRLNIKDEIIICDSENSENYSAEIEVISKEKIECKILKKIDKIAEGNVELHIYQGIPKADKMELIIQKGTELGITEFIPIKLSRCVVKLTGKDEDKKLERWNKISEVAAKQSGRDIIPKVRKIENINSVCEKIKDYDLVLLAYELNKNNYIKNELKKIQASQKKYKIAVIIGPEGGIDEKEAELFERNGAKIVSLGNRILRTETASMQIASIIMYELEDNGGN